MKDTMEEKRLTPMQAIHAYCVRCMGNNPNIVREQCTYKQCPLYSRRMGEGPHDGTKTLKQIRAHCIECRGIDKRKDVEECSGRLVDGKCPLHEFRMGKNPVLAGKRGNGEALKKWMAEQASKKTDLADGYKPAEFSRRS